MSARIGQPVNQVRLTNVAMVRMRKGGRRFEIACYPNKVLGWRKGVEQDIDEILQTHAIFTNVSKGQLASGKDLNEAFGKDDVEELVRYILEKGEYHPSDREREVMIENTLRDIATIVCERTVNPDSNRPYTFNLIMNGMKDIHYAVNTNKSAKQQALDVIKRLTKVMPLERAKMHLRIAGTQQNMNTLTVALKSLGVVPERLPSGAAEEELDLLVDPGLFRSIDKLVRSKAEGQAQLRVMDLNVQEEGQADVGFEIARKAQIRQQKEASLRAAAAEEEEEEKPEPGISEDQGQDAKGTVQSTGGSRRVGDEGEDDPTEAGRRAGKKSKTAKRREKADAEDREMRRRDQAERRDRREAEKAQAPPGRQLVLPPEAPPDLREPKKLACNTCQAGFTDARNYREHYRSDLHRFNLKLKERGGDPIDEKEFALCDAEVLFDSHR